jgi:hypothetical protein
MALIQKITCEACGETKMDEYHSFCRHEYKCWECWSKEQSKKRRLHLSSLKGLTVEERLERIEAALYDSDADQRIGILESIHRTYA